MTTDFALNNYIVSGFKNSEDEDTLTNITNVIKSNFKDIKLPEEDVSNDYNKLLNLLTLTLKNFSNASWKIVKAVDVTDIDQIKVVLRNYTSSSTKVAEFKKELIADLTKFQNQITTNHNERLEEYKKQYRTCRRQIDGFEAEKNSLIMERLSKIVWPYDAQTKEYENKIARLEILVKQYERKIEEAKKFRPMASERDLMLYQMHLKETLKK
jgi:hypothetical protein